MTNNELESPQTEGGTPSDSPEPVVTLIPNLVRTGRSVVGESRRIVIRSGVKPAPTQPEPHDGNES